MAHLPDILRQIQEGGGWTPFDFEHSTEDDHSVASDPSRPAGSERYDIIWLHSLGALLDSANSAIALTVDGIEHAGLQLELLQPGKARSFFDSILGNKGVEQVDIESDAQTIKPGDPRFSNTLEEKLKNFMQKKTEALTAWANSEGLTTASLEDMNDKGDFEKIKQPANVHIHRDRQQLYLLLYIQHMVSRRPLVTR